MNIRESMKTPPTYSNRIISRRAMRDIVSKRQDQAKYEGQVRWCFTDAAIPCEWRGPYTLTVTGLNAMKDSGVKWERVP